MRGPGGARTVPPPDRPTRRHSMATEVRPPDAELKARHRAMWASGDYPSMVETFLLPLGPRLVEACGIAAGATVLDVAAGTGNASLEAARTQAHVTASDLTPSLLEAGGPPPPGPGPSPPRGGGGARAR